MSTEKYNKEQIRNRMLKYAAAFWGIKKSGKLRPGCQAPAGSVVQRDIYAGRGFYRHRDKAAGKDRPNPYSGHLYLTLSRTRHRTRLSHRTVLPDNPGIGHVLRERLAYPEAIDRKRIVLSRLRYPAAQSRREIYVCDDLLYRIAPTLEKTMIARAETRMPPRTVWLGMAVDESISDLEDFSFYLDFPNLTESYEYLLLLPCTEWSVEGKTVVMEGGIHEKTTIQKEPTRAFFQDYDVMSVIDKEVMDIYSKHFLKVSQSFPLDGSCRKNLPDTLRSCFKEAVLEKMQDKLVWVKIQFPAHFTAEVLEELHAGINIVPVENKTLHEQTTTLEETFRVIPLRTGSYESLLSVHSVKDSDGKNYHELLYPAKDSTESYGTYSIRKGGCERFDSRSAKELLGYLSDLLDDETHAFNAVSSIKLQALTIQMEQLMAQMKQTADNMNEFRETPYYLMIDELSGKGQITVKYWTTNCEVGNRIQAGVNLSPNATTYLDPKTLALVSTTYGGKQAPQNRERIDIYKYASFRTAVS